MCRSNCSCVLNASERSIPISQPSATGSHPPHPPLPPCLQSATACPFPLYGDKQFVYSEGQKVNHGRRGGKIWPHVAIFTSDPRKLGTINTREPACVFVWEAGVLCHHPPSIKSNRRMTGGTKTNLLLRHRINDQWQVFVVLVCVCTCAFMRKRQECVGLCAFDLSAQYLCVLGVK